LEVCGHLDERKICPISKSPCPGVCIYADIMENIYLGILVLDISNKTVVFKNPSAVEILKPIKGKMDYKTLGKLLIPDMDEYLSQASETRKDILQMNDRVLGYSAYRVSNRFIWVFIRDITEKTRLESIAQAVNTTNNIGYIFSGIRHEIGNPINSIKMTLSVLRKNINKYPKKTVVEYIDRSVEEISRIEYLLKSLKNFNMFENPNIKKVDLPAFMDKFLSLVKNDFEKQGMPVEMFIHSGSDWIHTDPRALQQVLLNIMTNASDALKDKEDPLIMINVQPLYDRVLLSINDNGCGMTVEEQKNLFRPFVTNKPDGTGLGLVIAKKTLSKMDTSIDISSRKGAGTTVTLSMPGDNNWEHKKRKKPS
jgi:signal transduction histidine kinase